jgi:hypothetical protein
VYERLQRVLARAADRVLPPARAAKYRFAVGAHELSHAIECAGQSTQVRCLRVQRQFGGINWDDPATTLFFDDTLVRSMRAVSSTNPAIATAGGASVAQMPTSHSPAINNATTDVSAVKNWRARRYELMWVDGVSEQHPQHRQYLARLCEVRCRISCVCVSPVRLGLVSAAVPYR